MRFDLLFLHCRDCDRMVVSIFVPDSCPGCGLVQQTDTDTEVTSPWFFKGELT